MGLRPLQAQPASVSSRNQIVRGQLSAAPQDRRRPEPVAGAGFFRLDKLRGLDLAQVLGAKTADKEGGSGNGYLEPLVRDFQDLPGGGGVVVHEERGIIELYLLPPEGGGGTGLGIAAPDEVENLPARLVPVEGGHLLVARGVVGGLGVVLGNSGGLPLGDEINRL